jgi:hypothetical protein
MWLWPLAPVLLPAFLAKVFYWASDWAELGVDGSVVSSGSGGGVVAIVHPIQARIPKTATTTTRAVICRTTTGNVYISQPYMRIPNMLTIRMHAPIV